MKSREEILGNVRVTMANLFELEPAQVAMEARFYEDLAIDSIDAVDLIDQLARAFERRVSPQDFRNVRSVRDLVELIDKLQEP
jgi:acyl carrier protein